MYTKLIYASLQWLNPVTATINLPALDGKEARTLTVQGQLFNEVCEYFVPLTGQHAFDYAIQLLFANRLEVLLASAVLFLALIVQHNRQSNEY